MILEDVTISEILEFGKTITQDELKYYDDFDAKSIIQKGVYAKGIKINRRLIGIGGFMRTYGVNNTFYMIKKEYQGKGLGNFITENNIAYAKRHKIPLLFYICSTANAPIIHAIKKYGDKEVCIHKDKRYSYIGITNKGKLMGYFLPIVVRLFVLIKKRS